ncbi:MAG: SPFH domain-containing protein [Candidatus Bathyarchaeia archaeon]
MAGFIYGKLARLGISAVESIGERMVRGVRATEWNRSAHPGLIYHIPSNEIKFLKLVIVKEYESGVFLRDGKIYAVLPPGRWFLGRMPIVGQMEFIWVDKGRQKINFGLRTLASDGVELGANGVVYLSVSDAERFITNLVTARDLFTSKDLESFLRDQINSIMRAEMANYDTQSLYMERDMFVSVARVKLREMFSDTGLEFHSIEVSGILLPPEVREKMREPMFARKEAEAIVARGTAQADILSKIREAGVDPVKYRAAEALMKYSERPSGEGTPLGGDFLMPMVFYGMLMKDSSLPVDVKNMLKKQFPDYESNITQPSIISSEEPAVEVQEVLDGLDVRLAKGEISEELYKRLKAKWEKRLEED